MMEKRFFFIWFLLLSPFAGAQTTMGFEDFMDWVKEFHPVASQADITLQFGEQEVRMARGGFDPLLYGDLDNKVYNTSNYYDKREAGIVIPVFGPVDLKGNFEQNTGTFLNPEKSVPSEGLITAGASINIGEGLFIDRARATFRQAKIFQESTKAERQQILNNLYVDAARAYWDWSANYSNREVLREGVRLAEIRFEGIKSSFEFGDLPAIDTIEAYTQVLNRVYRLQQAEIDYFNTLVELNTFLWNEDQEPMNILDTIVPENVLKAVDMVYEKEMLRQMLNTHPDLLLVDFDLDLLDIERRWNAEQLKPVVKFNYNVLTQSINQLELSPFFENNYKWGITVYTPLFLRKERGALGMTKARISFRQNDRDLLYLRLAARLEGELNAFETFRSQFGVYADYVQGLRRLLDGELIRFEIGESSLFLINAREIAYFDSQLTLNDIAAKRNISYAKLLNAAGVGFDF
ncbi:TolC family protein [Pararhodonellum marinum]|uniref:TolC family protein n=1 Tax=Pararhodonellum marinum TaxID=2755358 RepID=UPI001E402195|nr:TolC family protein [Pararhodonellum marinum]